MVKRPKLSFGSTRNQYFAAISANLLMLSFGCTIGWVSPALPLLQSPDTPLSSGPMTTEQISWTGSTLSVGALVGNILYGYLMVRYGSKMVLMSLAVPQLASWFLMLYGTIAEHIYASRLLSGLAGGGIQTAMTIYFAEISDDSIRGILGTSYQLSRCFGILITYILEVYINYIQLSMIMIVLTLAYAISFYTMPPTPQYLLKIGADERARRAFKYYTGVKKEDKEFDDAFFRLQLISKESKLESDFSWKDIFEPVARKGLIIGIVLACLSQLCGSYLFITYGSTIFEKSGTNLSKNASSIILAVVQVIGTVASAKFVETQGRKILLIISLAGCTVGQLALATYLYCDSLGFDLSMLNWVPVTSLAFVILVSGIGILSLSFMCTVEVLPTKVRSFGVTVGMVAMNIMSFLTAGSFPILMETIELYGCMAILGVSCALGMFFVIIYMQETKGKTLDLLNEEKAKATNNNV